MAIDAGSSGNISRYYSVPDSAGLSLPNKDWTWLTLIRPTQTPTEVTYIISKGAYFEDQSFNLYLYPGSGLVCQVSMLGSVLSGSTLPNDKWYWAYATRRSSVLKVGYCEVGTSLSFETGSESIVNEYNSTSALNIGRRSDGDIGRYWQGRYSDTLFINGYSLTQSDVRALALGNRIEDMSFYDHVMFHAEFSSASKSYLADKTGRYALTRNGTGWGPAEKSPTSRPYASGIEDFIPSVLSAPSSIIIPGAIKAISLVAQQSAVQLGNCVLSAQQQITMSAVASSIQAGSIIFSNQTSIVLNRPTASVLTFNIIGCIPGVISASPSAALIQVGSDVVIPGSVSAVSISSYAASIVLVNNVVVSTSISSISLSQQQSNIQLGYTIGSPAAALSLSPSSSVVTLGNDVVISSTIKTISISPASSGIVQQSIVGAITKNILLAASQSNVLLDASVIIQANQGSLLLNSQQSGIVSNIVVNGIPVGISVSPNSSSILQSNVISSQIKNIALSSNQCSFILDNIIFGNTTSLQLSIMQAGIYSGGIVPVISDENISMTLYKGGISMSASAKNISMIE